MANRALPTQGYFLTPWRKQVNGIVRFLSILVIAGLMLGIYLNITARSAMLGRHVQRTQNSIEKMELTIAHDQTYYAQLTSTKAMESRAKNMGFFYYEPGVAVFLNVDSYKDREIAELAPFARPHISPFNNLSDKYDNSIFNWIAEKIFFPTPSVGESK